MKNRLALLALTLVVVSCDNEALIPPTATVDNLFASYVALGNSLTAGFQSGGINDSTQAESYAVLVAAQMGTSFVVPELRSPGCPAPFVNVFTQERVGTVGGTPPPACALRSPEAPPIINNVSFPGADVLETFTYTGNPVSETDVYKTFLLGGLTPMQVARRAAPTFVTVWIGNNDVLSAALVGDASLSTPPGDFATRYVAMLDSLESFGTIQGGLLVAVANVANVPHFSAGVVYFGARQAGQLPPSFTVSNNCAPAALGGQGETTLVPFSYGFGELMAAAQAGQPANLDCVNDAEVLTTAEVAQLVNNVTSYNQLIEQEASDRGWAFLDPNPALNAFRAAGQIPIFPVTSGAAAVTAPFGQWFSRDGFHISTEAHRLVAVRIIEAINERYGTSIPLLP